MTGPEQALEASEATTSAEPEGEHQAAADDGAEPHRLWGGRFETAPDAALDALNRSLPVDHRLWPQDVRGSLAWLRALERADLVTPEEADTLDGGLRRVADRLADGAAEGAPDEDIHTLVERLLYDEVGALAGKLHTGRSRNDQVATDSRLWAIDAIRRLEEEMRTLQSALLERAEATVDLLVPAYTHLRRAQVIRVAHWLLAHFWAIERDRGRLVDALDRVSTLPLGSGAIAGAGFPLDRGLLKELLGFRYVSENSLDAVGDRDWICELVFVAATLGAHLSRLAEDLILYSTAEFDFVRLPEAFTTGSSMLPQKRNPDGLELARAKAARLAGDVAGALALLKGLPSGYHKDLQEDKTLLFGTFDTLFLVLPVTSATVAGLTFDEDALRDASGDGDLFATDLADELVRRGVPFREAHAAVGRIVRRAEQEGWTLDRPRPDALAEAHPAFAEGEPPHVDAAESVEAKAVDGGTSRDAVRRQLARARRTLTSSPGTWLAP